ncbi:G2/mitotic-specific cyclin-B2-like [Neocloeon triangulifer]|uniref:G2/mitotic-specific cyclin-B2-like n=1 Tax=Neocloeon triangulifer TaxID=2078957 RepID=UPI00286F91C6|nr:G2/mitotic-specific cyclin-B2-like [Neocloeon triangulifer]XP_059474753.1 G2/mitotic-specific cyclin-B2-like [Neocloeon triangulifer]
MAENARPVRVTRRNFQSSGLLKENVLAKDAVTRKVAPLQHVRSTLGEISNKATVQMVTIGKGGGLTLNKPNANLKENAPLAKPKLTLASKATSKPVAEQKPAGLSVREKPAAAKPGILRRVTNIMTNQAVPQTKPKVSLAAPKPVVRVKPSILQVKPKEEAPKVESTKNKPDFSGFSNEQIKQLEKLDTRDRDNAQNAADYVGDIYSYLRELEVTYSVPMGYIKQCKQMTFHMRAVLIDWIVGVHRQFKLTPETLYLTVAIFDRYMPTALATPKSQLQLVGVTCLLLAAKYEEIMCPTIGDCVYVTDNTYNKKQVADMEMKILSALNFNIGRPLPLHFLRRFTKTSDATYEDHCTAKYFMELLLVRHELCHVAPSLQAAAALCLSLLLNSEEEQPTLAQMWTPTLHFFSAYSFAEVEAAVKLVAAVVVKGHTSSLTAVRKKYSTKSQAEISQFVEGKLEMIKSLIQ